MSSPPRRATRKGTDPMSGNDYRLANGPGPACRRRRARRDRQNEEGSAHVRRIIGAMSGNLGFVNSTNQIREAMERWR